ncbi:hypothetical protein SBV1_1570073 [Verrucomicrobia bacterium]|nr:hypothetical protein SBV1_1570073 [Verrucomicrobiota bacterium]
MDQDVSGGGGFIELSFFYLSLKKGGRTDRTDLTDQTNRTMRGGGQRDVERCRRKLPLFRVGFAGRSPANPTRKRGKRYLF